ncbi:MAG: hypothetical protein O7G85_02600 [Planctomycetota bacterium]|nr:hypothetical protein [Planctomycetota bacterium]
MVNEQENNNNRDGADSMVDPNLKIALHEKIAGDAENLSRKYGAFAGICLFLITSTWIARGYYDSNDRKILELEKKKFEQSKTDIEERMQTIDLLQWAELSGPPRVNIVLSSLILGYRWRWEIIEPYSKGWTTLNSADRIKELNANIEVLMKESRELGGLDPESGRSPYTSPYDIEMKRRLWVDWGTIYASLEDAIRDHNVEGIRNALDRWRVNNDEFFVLASRRLNEVVLSDFSLPHGNENLWPQDLRIALGTLRLAVAIQFEVIEPYYDISALDFEQRAERLNKELARVLNETDRSGYVNKASTIGAFGKGELKDRIVKTFDESEQFMPALRDALASKDQSLVEAALNQWRITNYNYLNAAAERCAELLPRGAGPQ